MNLLKENNIRIVCYVRTRQDFKHIMLTYNSIIYTKLVRVWDKQFSKLAVIIDANRNTETMRVFNKVPHCIKTEQYQFTHVFRLEMFPGRDFIYQSVRLDLVHNLPLHNNWDELQGHVQRKIVDRMYLFPVCKALMEEMGHPFTSLVFFGTR